MSPRLIHTSLLLQTRTGLDSILTMMDPSALRICNKAWFLSTSSSNTSMWSKPPPKSRASFIQMLSLICNKSLKRTRSLKIRPLKKENRMNRLGNKKVRCSEDENIKGTSFQNRMKLGDERIHPKKKCERECRIHNYNLFS